MGKEINGIKSKKRILLVWTECLGCPKVEGGVLGKFYHKRLGKQEWIKNQIKAQNQKGFFLEETKSKKRFLRGQT